MASNLSSTLARAGALALSVSILGLLLFRSATGCRSSEPTVQAEAPASSAKAQAPGPMSASPPASQSAQGATSKPRYFPGAKAPAGRWADDDEDNAKKPAPNQPPAQQK